MQDNASSQRREAVAAGLHCYLLCQVKSQGTTHLHARVCARSGTCQMWDRNSATTDRHVCRQCKTMRAEERGCRCWFALLPPLSGEKSMHYTLARVCARSGTCQMWDRNSATTDRYVCRQCKTMRAVRERLLLLVCIVGLASCSDHAEHC